MENLKLPKNKQDHKIEDFRIVGLEEEESDEDFRFWDS